MAILITGRHTSARIPDPTQYRSLSDQDRRNIHAARLLARRADR